MRPMNSIALKKSYGLNISETRKTGIIEGRKQILDELKKYCEDKDNITYFDQPYGGWSDNMIPQKDLLEKIKSLYNKGD